MASTSPLWSTPCHLCPKQLSKLTSDSRFGHHFCTGNRTMRYKERYLMLVECLITFLGCMRIIGGAFDNIDKHFMVHSLSFLSKTPIKVFAKCHISDFRYPQHMGNMRM